MENHLRQFTQQLQRDGVEERLHAEYRVIRSQPIKQTSGLTTEVGALKENVKKNRYRDILPYDQTRVPLSFLAEECESDYINANFIQGAISNKVYIATQGPLKHTLVDLWRMIWQYGVKVIMMACRENEMGKKKCEPYWTSPGKTAVFGPFVVTNVDESNQKEGVVFRFLRVKYESEARNVSQFQYTAWPDHDVPYTSDGILGMMALVRKAQASSTAPILIHCSAGCGRSGVICVVDYIYDLLQTKRINKDFNIMDVVLKIRHQRPSAVQTKEQYKFVFDMVAQMFEEFLSSSASNNNENLSEETTLHPPLSPKRRVIAQPESKPRLTPRTSLPVPERMSDTYAVVNKARQRPPSAMPAYPNHHYENNDLGPKPMPIYSTIKPKTVATNISIPSSKAQDDAEDYEYVEGVSSVSDKTAKPQSTEISSSICQTSSDSDYEYVLQPKAKAPDQEGGMGFNCRIQKPKGPREPPAEWSRAER